MLQVVFKINSINSKIKIDLKKYVFCYITDVNLKTGQLKAKKFKKKRPNQKKKKMFLENYLHKTIIETLLKVLFSFLIFVKVRTYIRFMFSLKLFPKQNKRN